MEMERRGRERVPSLEERANASTYSSFIQTRVTLCRFLDASTNAVGVVLMQDHGQGNQPITFASRKMTPSEAKQSVYNRELTAMIWALAQWRHYLEGSQGGATVYTNHEIATHFVKQAVLSWMQARFMNKGYFLSILLIIKCVKGKENVIAYALLRCQPAAAKAAINMFTFPQVEKEGNKAWIRGLDNDPETRKLF